MNIASAKLKSGEDGILDICVLNEGDSLMVHGGKGKIKITPEAISERLGERERAGEAMPKQLKGIEFLELIPAIITEIDAPSAD